MTDDLMARRGQILIPRELYELGEVVEALAKIKFVPLKIELDQSTMRYELIGVSPEFAALQPGFICPPYTLKINEDGSVECR